MYADMVELADALDSGSSGSNTVQVQVLLSAPSRKASDPDAFFVLCRWPSAEAGWGISTAFVRKLLSAGAKKFSPRQNRPVSLERILGRALQQVGGGYAQALQALYEQMGIPCLTVSGQWNGENHMWNLVWLDGEWRYCDATSDRGRSEFGFGCYRVTAENLWGHTWDQDWIVRLTSGLKV